MRLLDRRAIEEFGIEAKLLMENAGHAAYYALREEFEIRGKRFLIFCGTGNNGGDGCVLARKIHADGGFVKVFILGDPGKYRGAAKLNHEIVTRLPVEIQRITTAQDLPAEIARCHMMVDAIFGTGLSRDVGGIYRDVIEIINQSKKPVLSIDIPSGVHGDSGMIMGVAVKANYTVTFGLPKYGNMLYPGFDLGGKLYVSHISFPPLIYMSDTLKVEVNHPLEFATVEREKIGKQLVVEHENIIDLQEHPRFLEKFYRRDLLILDINELSNIAAKSAKEVDINKVNVLQQIVKRINATIVLKGARPLISFPDQRVYINLSGSLGINNGKLWDKLGNTIAAMYSLGLSLQQAVRQGVFIHGLAGDLAVEEHHQKDVATNDLLNALPRAMKMVQAGLDPELEKHYTGTQII
jgi:hydroxyethylthiazole kinase-like uncharacterized protein yjeF